jgi:hypothetical protein
MAIMKKSLDNSLVTWIKSANGGKATTLPAGSRGAVDWYVDSTEGSDNYSGDSWENAFASIGKAITAIGTDTFNRIFVAPGDYLVTEAIAVTAEGTQIIGCGDDNRNVCLVYTATAGIDLMTLDAHHIEIVGMSFSVVPDGQSAIVVSGTSAGYKNRIANCRFDLGSGEYAIYVNESPDIVIEDNMFRSWSTTAIRTYCTRAVIRRNRFLLMNAGTTAIEHVSTGGNRPDTEISFNTIHGINSTDTGIKLTGTPTEKFFHCFGNQITNVATPITAQRYTSWYDGNFFGVDDGQYHSSINSKGGRVFYVDANAGTTGVDGRSWKSAYLTLTEAVAVATARFDEIVMREGDYDEGAAVAISTQGLTIRSENPDSQNRAMIWRTTGTYNLMEIDAHEVTLDGISFSAAPDTKSAIVVSGTSASYKCHFKNLRLDGWSGEYGIYLNESPDTLIENCLFRSWNTAAVYSNSTRTIIRDCIFHVVAGKVGIEHVPSGGNRPDNVYIRNYFSGVTSTSTTGIKLTGVPSNGACIIADNRFAGSFDTTITQSAATVAVENWNADSTGGAQVDATT